jgi:DNA repair/transcription protein MET18/MMS19
MLISLLQDAYLCQDMFEAAFNYFPITFRPPPDDPYGITSQDLKDRLRACISASADFSPYAFPALLDKLDSTSMNTKVCLHVLMDSPDADRFQRDVLQAIFSCVQNYGPRTVNLYAVTLWDALKFEVLHVSDEDLAVESLLILGEIARQLSIASNNSLAAYLKPVAKECNEHLEDAPTKQSQAATRILYAVASASPAASNFLLSAVIPNIFSLYQTSENIAKRRGLVETLAQLVRANITVYGEWRQSPRPLSNGDLGSPTLEPPPANALLGFSSQALDMITGSLSSLPVKEVSFRLTLLDALLQLAKVRGLLTDEQISKVVNFIDQVIIAEESYGKDEMKAAAINGLVEIAHQKSQLVIESAFPAFMAKLPDKDEEGPETYVPILEAFAKLGDEDKVFDTVVVRLKNKLNSAIMQKGSATYIQAILSALLFAFSQGARDLHGTVDKKCPYFEDFLQPLIKKICVEADAEQQDDAAFYLVGRICNTILRQQTSDFHRSICGELYTLYLGSQPDEVLPLNLDVKPVSEGRHMIISTYLLASLRKDVVLPYDLKGLLTSLAELALRDGLSPGVRVATLQQISLLVNKSVPNSEMKATLDPILRSPLDLLSPQKLDKASIRVVFAIFKALILRNAPAVNDIFTSLCESLSDVQNGTAVAHGFSTLLQPDEILTKENHCSISPLHKQKLFAILVPNILSGFKSAGVETKKNYLIALSGMLRWIPYSVLEPQLSSLILLLLQTLDITGEEDVKSGTVDTLSSVLRQSPKDIEEHTSSLITRLLNNSTTKNNPPKVRAKSLQCLTLVPVALRTELVIPFRKQVVKRLTPALDDSRRAVRQEAVRCRAKWIELDEAGDGDEGEDDE